MKTLNQLTSEAIGVLYPETVSSGKSSEGEWIALDSEQVGITISQSAIDAKLVELQAEYDNAQYARDRQYPSTGDQLDMIFHAIEAGTLDTTSEFFTTLKAVKDANPKA